MSLNTIRELKLTFPFTINVLRRDGLPKNENPAIMYSPTCHFKPMNSNTLTE